MPNLPEIPENRKLDVEIATKLFGLTVHFLDTVRGPDCFVGNSGTKLPRYTTHSNANQKVIDWMVKDHELLVEVVHHPYDGSACRVVTSSNGDEGNLIEYTVTVYGKTPLIAVCQAALLVFHQQAHAKHIDQTFNDYFPRP